MFFHVENVGKELEERPMEMVERKGLGHPDTIMDALAEEFSRNLCKRYLEEFYAVMHHNVDKGLLVAGRAEVAFGKGKILERIKIILSGRATREWEGKKIPVEEIAEETVREYLERNFLKLRMDHIELKTFVRQGSPDLISIFMKSQRNPLANDTSIGVGFYPLSSLENAVLSIEKHLNSREFKKRNPFLGEDIKVMGIRKKDEASFTIAAALFAEEVKSKEEYLNYTEKVKEDVARLLKNIGFPYDFNVEINTGDDPERGVFYLTYTGTSAEHGDDGEVGRGNRANGLITPMRPMSLEASAGKNPINHVGKIYNVWANEMAKRIYRDLNVPAEIMIVSQIGKPISEPYAISVTLYSEENLGREVQSILLQGLDELPNMSEKIIMGEFIVY